MEDTPPGIIPRAPSRFTEPRLAEVNLGLRQRAADQKTEIDIASFSRKMSGSIELELEQEVSAVAPTSTPGTLTPTITERRVHSTVRMTSGQTVLLGGLISENNETTKAGIPVVDQIKYLGDLLSNKTDIRNRTEIIIFVKAQLIRNGFDAQKVSEEFRERLQSMMTPRAVVTGTDMAPPPVVKK